MPLLLVLEGDVRVQHNGYPLRLIGPGDECTVHFPTLRSFCQWAALLWFARKTLPNVHGLNLQWKAIRIRVSQSMGHKVPGVYDELG